jgi:hypothetical protein
MTKELAKVHRPLIPNLFKGTQDNVNMTLLRVQDKACNILTVSYKRGKTL